MQNKQEIVVAALRDLREKSSENRGWVILLASDERSFVDQALRDNFSHPTCINRQYALLFLTISLLLLVLAAVVVVFALLLPSVALSVHHVPL